MHQEFNEYINISAIRIIMKDNRITIHIISRNYLMQDIIKSLSMSSIAIPFIPNWLIIKHQGS